MKVSHVESLASYGGSESCVRSREGVGEALTGVRAGRVLSREIHAPWRKLRVVRGAEAEPAPFDVSHEVRNVARYPRGLVVDKLLDIQFHPEATCPQPRSARWVSRGARSGSYRGAGLLSLPYLPVPLERRRDFIVQLRMHALGVVVANGLDQRLPGLIARGEVRRVDAFDLDGAIERLHWRVGASRQLRRMATLSVKLFG